MTIRITGHQWWWEVQYPAQGIITANEYDPSGGASANSTGHANVIHSFWVPQLHWQTRYDSWPDQSFWLEASEPGEYWGLCAEFCGIQHANMLFVVVAEERPNLRPG